MAIVDSLLSELLILIGALLVVYVIFALGRVILGIMLNIILGFIAIEIINALFALAIPFDFIVIVLTALLGLVGVAIVVVLKFLGVGV
ncbi:MAG: hypothetical protein KGH67_05730 [Candidatus Micrarchaeota archaeon]|nr:hypothetical protein [Candidatus Micrarchaeota archaeon]